MRSSIVTRDVIDEPPSFIAVSPEHPNFGCGFNPSVARLSVVRLPSFKEGIVNSKPRESK